jgi:hypothetical protein
MQMAWPEEMYHQNAVAVREAASTLARLLVDEAEDFLAAHPEVDLDVQQITEERLGMMSDALDERIAQQFIVRGHIKD